MTRFLAMGVLAFALTGCGTVRNFQESKAGTQPYGGVKIAIDRLKGEGDIEYVGGNAVPIPEELRPLLFWPIDVPLCVVGDTATLPVTLPIAVVRAVHAWAAQDDIHFPSGSKPEQIPQWLQDSQPSTRAPAPMPASP